MIYKKKCNEDDLMQTDKNDVKNIVFQLKTTFWLFTDDFILIG
jgi:hypothetical protein